MHDSDSTDNKVSSRERDSSAQGNSVNAHRQAEPMTLYEELLAQAQQFLQDDNIKNAPREKQVAFLEEKGIKTQDIERLLEGSHGENDKTNTGLQTIHDSTIKTASREHARSDAGVDIAISEPASVSLATREAPPIITYPEFLLKPQKPPPLVTVERLLYAAYGFAGLSALTYGASKYVVEPMLEALSDARHNLATKTLEDLEQLNQKLETTVSHVPYSATLAALKAQREHDEDLESLDSDPTELFHRDIATQTSPALSRSSSSASLPQKNSLDATNKQASRLKDFQETLESLVSSVDPTEEPFLPPTSTKQLHDTVAQLQSMLDKLESTYNPFRSDYNSIYSTNPTSGRGDNNEAAKFKAEIRSLKGAFLSSRNFPAARPSSFGTTGAR